MRLDKFNWLDKTEYPFTLHHYKVKGYNLHYIDEGQGDTFLLSFAKSLLNDQHWFGQLWAKKQYIANKPTLIIWGMKDPIIKKHYLEKFVSGFANSRTMKLWN